MAPRTHHFKGKVKRAVSDDTAQILAARAVNKKSDMNKKAQQNARAADALRQQKTMMMRGGKELQTKTKNVSEILRALAGGQKGVLLKMVWASWQVFLILMKEEKELRHRDELWRMSCPAESGFGPCGAHNKLLSSTLQLPAVQNARTVEGKSRSFSLPWNVARAAAKFLRPIRGTPGGSAAQENSTASRLAGKVANALEFGGGLGKDAKIVRTEMPVLKAGEWEACHHHGTGKTVWHNKMTGQMRFNDFTEDLIGKKSGKKFSIPGKTDSSMVLTAPPGKLLKPLPGTALGPQQLLKRDGAGVIQPGGGQQLPGQTPGQQPKLMNQGTIPAPQHGLGNRGPISAPQHASGRTQVSFG